MNHAQHSARNKPNKISLVIVLPPDFFKISLAFTLIMWYNSKSKAVADTTVVFSFLLCWVSGLTELLFFYVFKQFLLLQHIF